MFNLPMINPENVSRDFIDVFGGYNHNLRIGDNEFYDMKNMSSSCYPLLATRQKRGSVPASAVDKDKVVGMIYRSAFYYVTAVYGPFNRYVEPLTLHKLDGDTHTVIKQFDLEDCVSSEQKKLIMMGAYMLIFPDKVYVNVENPEDYGNIECEVETTNDTVTIQPCLEDGSVISIDYVGDKSPTDYGEGFVWVDTSVDPASVKRYSTKQDVWIPVLFQYIRLTGNNTEIASGFDVGDGVKISGVSIGSEDYDLNGVSILRAKPDDNSLVVSGVFTNDSIKVFEQIEDRGDYYKIRVFCDKSVVANQFRDKVFIFGDKEYTCQSNTAAKPYEYWIDNDYSMSSFQADYLTVDATVPWTAGDPFKNVNVVRQVSNGITESIVERTEDDNFYVKLGTKNSNFNVFKYTHDGSMSAVVKLTAQNSSYLFIENGRRIISGTKIYPIKRGDSKGLYEITLTFPTGNTYPLGKIALKPDYVVEHTDPIKFERKMPVMDYMVESGNRLWGCRYGKNADGDFVNEIYASKSGNTGFKNWQCFEGGIATNSYAVSRGIDGPWTGAICYLGHPVFFKENYIETVYGSFPAQFSINSVTARGVQHGSEKSLAILNEVLYYMSPEGVCQYNGSLPTNISYNFGDLRYSEAVACAFNGKYYIKMLDKNAAPVFMVYDSTRNLWHKEDDVDIRELCPIADDIYYVFENWELRSLFGTGGQDPDPIEWYAETGIYGLSQTDSKYISRLNVRMALDKGSTVILSIQYDSSGVWERLCTVVRQNINPFTLPIKPRRCDHFRLRLEGTGGAKIYSISKTIEQGSDIV